MRRRLIVMVLGAVVWPAAGAGQIDLRPTHLKPAAWERIDLRVVNQTDNPITEVALTVPEVVAVLGVDAPEGWSFEIERATEQTPQVVRFRGGTIGRWELREFSFLGRLDADIKRENLVFPTRVTRTDGTTTEWARTDQAEGDPPTIVVQGTTEITAWGTLAAAAGAFGISVLALGFAIARSRPSETPVRAA